MLKIKALEVRCRDDTTLTLHPELYRLLLNGLSNGVFNDLICKQGVVSVRDFVIPLYELLASKDVLDALRLGWKYDKDYGCWFKDDVKFKHMSNYILEVFDYREYEDINVRNMFVVDVGAGYGETALYFLKMGAKYVIAVEPCPTVYSEMLENLKLNNVIDKVTTIKAAISSTQNSTIIECPNEKVITNAIMLKDILEKFDIDQGVLKMDCEGCEYDVILNDYERVRLFNEVYFEYHAYVAKIPVELLLKKLSRDFICKVVSDDEFYKRHGLNKELIGIIKCVKK